MTKTAQHAHLMLHPAKFSVPILERLEVLVPEGVRVLDPFAGVGYIHMLDHLGRDIIGVEIEEPWARNHPDTIVADAHHLPFPDGSFDCIVTSPCYGNRFADHHNASDNSLRRSYTHDMRAAMGSNYHLHANNAGTLHWGLRYRKFHQVAWREAHRVLMSGGLFFLNVSDHIRSKHVQPVTAWHKGCIKSLGFAVDHEEAVKTQRMRRGENHELRVDGEHIIVFRKAA